MVINCHFVDTKGRLEVCPPRADRELAIDRRSVFESEVKPRHTNIADEEHDPLLRSPAVLVANCDGCKDHQRWTWQWTS